MSKLEGQNNLKRPATDCTERPKTLKWTVLQTKSRRSQIELKSLESLKWTMCSIGRSAKVNGPIILNFQNQTVHFRSTATFTHFYRPLWTC